MTTSLDRRTLFQATAAAIAATATATDLLSPARTMAAETTNKSLADGATVLFQGDSITDAGRDQGRRGANDARAFGDGYPMLIASGLLRDHAAKNLSIYNRGISGNKVPDLAARWQQDCYDLKPDVLSILIGVNDMWHKLNGNYNGDVEVYRTGYQQLLETTLEKMPGVRIAVCEPFVLRCGAVSDKWFPEFTQRLDAARQVASDLSLELVPFQVMFEEATKVAPPAYWAGDGVHPTLAGHALMAETWRQTLDL